MLSRCELPQSTEWHADSHTVLLHTYLIVLMPKMIAGLTVLDCFEKVAQTMYSAQLLLTPAAWITENFVDESIATNATVLAMTNV